MYRITYIKNIINSDGIKKDVVFTTIAYSLKEIATIAIQISNDARINNQWYKIKKVQEVEKEG